MPSNPSLEIVIATYRNTAFLRCVLNALERSLDSDFSVVIAEDGQDPAIANVVDEFQRRLTLRHVTQPDDGFRKALILNKAVRTSSADYLVFIDQDCVPAPQFVLDHRTYAKPNTYIAGRRVYLGPRLTKRLLDSQLSAASLSNPFWLCGHAVTGQLRGIRYGLRLPEAYVLRNMAKRRGLKGMNMGMWREDLLRINGFDGDMTGPGGAEDNDIAWRLDAIGRTRALLTGRACVFHLHHPKQSTNPANRERIKEKQSAGEVRAVNGIDSTHGA